MDAVDATLKHWRQTAFEWGTEDCMLSVGDYIARCGHKDVTTMFRGRYDDREGALAFMEQFGGAPGLIEMTGVKRREGSPQRGDVVAMATDPIDGGTIGAICTGDMIAARISRGVIEVQMRLVKIVGAWTVG